VKIRSNFDVLLLLLACTGAIAAIALISVAGLHGTRFDTIVSGSGALHGAELIVVIPVVVVVGAFLLLLARSRRGS
jgi:uncharacterized membrane protein